MCAKKYRYVSYTLSFSYLNNGRWAKVGKGLKFSTNSFTYDECIYLVNVLYKNFNLKASVQSAGSKDQYILYI